jgi:hypothetical protein
MMGRLLFYPALWLAYREWKTERKILNNKLEGGAERTRLLDRYEDFIEYHDCKV